MRNNRNSCQALSVCTFPLDVNSVCMCSLKTIWLYSSYTINQLQYMFSVKANKTTIFQQSPFWRNLSYVNSNVCLSVCAKHRGMGACWTLWEPYIICCYVILSKLGLQLSLSIPSPYFQGETFPRRVYNFLYWQLITHVFSYLHTLIMKSCSPLL